MASIRTRVGVIIICCNKVLLVEHKKGSDCHWMIPGGGLEYGETIQDCARRELKEETNLDISLGRFLFLSESIAPDGSRHVINLFFRGYVEDFDTLALGDDPRLNRVSLVDIDSVDMLEMHPPFADKLKRILQKECLEDAKERSQYWGNYWTTR